ncbi:CocE/NonD family hydrolase [Actinomadura hibisca]|uniref:CocE/NonD family hydrolase n=1 Tax=Actinomadura hibisca TaxID=68565 RepID=UPI00083728F9|nr:CocE/NonD family hydrolase [Actinomadura hibisca]
MTALLGDVTVPGGLVGDVVLPSPRGRHPVLVIRTPYGKRGHLAEAHGWARRGVAVVVQDVRGRHESPGRWRPYADERADGLALVAWVRDQPWCDGRIVAYGSSYAAFCAVRMADAVTGVIAAVPALGLHETTREPGGAAKLYSHAWWWSTYADCRTDRAGLLDQRLAADPAALAHLPVTGLPDRLGLRLPGFAPAWRAPERPALSARTPLLCVAGLYDPFLHHAVELWRSWDGPASLVAGPWQHDLGLAHRDRNGDRPLLHRERAAEFVTAWLSALLAGQPEAPGARLAVESTRTWANVFGGTTVDLDLKGAGTFTADPADPFPSRMGPVDVAGDADRRDAVTAVGEPFTDPFTAVGRPRVRFAGSRDTPGQWVARLSEERPGGTALQLGHALGHGTDLTLPPLAHRFAPGTRLRVEIAAHHFPLHVRHPHTPADPLTATALRPSRREVDEVRLTLETA